MFYPKVGEFLSEDMLMADERTHLDGNGNIVTDKVLWPLTDQQGTVRDLAKVDANGATAVVDHIVYDSFGKVVSESDPSQGTLIGYAGLPYDKASGMNRSATRPYDPSTGQWTQADLIDFLGRDPNRYRYCGNSPTNATDPSGCATPDAHKLLDRYKLLMSLKPKLSDKQMVKALIVEALIITGGNAQKAFALILEIHDVPGVDNDIWVSVDHFFNSWTTNQTIPIGAGPVAEAANIIYENGKRSEFIRQNWLPRDRANRPPSQWTYMQYRWGSIGATAATFYNSNLLLGSEEWKSFLKWLDSK